MDGDDSGRGMGPTRELAAIRWRTIAPGRTRGQAGLVVPGGVRLGSQPNPPPGPGSAPPIRVLHLSREYPPLVWGGLGTALGGLATASAQAGMSVGVLLVGGPAFEGYGQALPPGLASTAVRGAVAGSGAVSIFQVPEQEPTSAALALVRSWAPDIVHVHPVELLPLARAIREQTAIPLVYTAHSLNFAEYSIGEEPPEILNLWRNQEELLSIADRVIVISRSEANLLRCYHPDAARRARVVGNGIHNAPVLPRATMGAEGDFRTVLFVGRFVPRKGIHDLLAAIPLVLETTSKVRFVLVGGYGSAEDVQRAWLPPHLHEYRDHIHFTGWLPSDRVQSWYRAADVLAVPSWYEPFGMVVLEGMLHGLPIAASSVGGPAEILESERTGVLFRPRDIVALAQALLRLLVDPVLRRQLGVAAWHEVRRNWLWCRIVEKIHEVYKEVIVPPKRSLPEGALGLRGCW